MIKFLTGGPGDSIPYWESTPPQGLTPEQAAYESDRRHSEMAKRIEGLRRYSISRALLTQPSISTLPASSPSRIAELYWDDVAAAGRGYNSPSGLANLGDVLVRMPFQAVNVPDLMSGPNLGFYEETVLPVRFPSVFDFAQGRFADAPFVIKAFAFVTVSGEETFDAWYERDMSSQLADVPVVGGHVLNKVIRDTMTIGNIVRGARPSADRIINLCFSNMEAVEEFSHSLLGKDYLADLDAHAEGVEWIITRSQELLHSTPLSPTLYEQQA